MTKELRPYQQDLFNRTQQAFIDGYNAPCIVSPCGSGKSIIIAEMIKKASYKKNHTLFLVHRNELKEQIRETLEWWEVDMDYVELGMVQTIVRRLERTKPPDLIITDENHHSLANSYRKIYDFFNCPRVGFTATPIRLNGGGLGEVNDILIEGPTVKELISWGNLAPFKYYAPQIVDTSKLRTRAGDYVKKDINELFQNKIIYGDVIAHYNKLSKGKKAICYCSSIKQSKEVAEIFNENNIPAKHIDGDTNKLERDQAIQNFRMGKVLVLCNVDLISEGFDVPDCNTAILLRPTQSLSLYIQQSMRAMRYKEGKTAIIIDHVGNVGRFGLPDIDREWTLEPKKGSNNSEPSLNPVKQCPECFMTLPTEYQICECGHEFIQEKEVKVEEDSELVEITDESIEINTMSLEDCKSVGDLYEYAKAQGYKPGWAYYQGKLRGWI